MIHPFSGWRRTRRRMLAAGTVLGCCAVMLLAAQLPAGALDVSGTPSPVTGNATWFTGLGSPYGGCGLPQADLDSQNFLALNVQNSPGVYSNLPRPIPAADASEIGMFDNGLNCGRWVQVTIGDYCTGTNDGAPDEPFCRDGSLGQRPVQRGDAGLRGRGQLRRRQRVVQGRPVSRGPGPGFAEPVRAERPAGRQHVPGSLEQPPGELAVHRGAQLHRGHRHRR